MTREAEASSKSRTTLAVKKKVAAGHLQKLLDKHRMTREAGASSQSRTTLAVMLCVLAPVSLVITCLPNYLTT